MNLTEDKLIINKRFVFFLVLIILLVSFCSIFFIENHSLVAHDESLYANRAKLIIDSNNQNLIGNRRPFSNGELFSLFLLIIIISISLIGSIFIASFTGKELETIPLWLIK